MTYAQVIKEEIGSNQVICTIGQDRKIGIPLIQYNETDWEFARRLASHFNKPIQSDIVTGNPRIWFGVRFGNEILKEYGRIFETNTYNVCISSKYYEVGIKLGLSKIYYITYKIKDGRNFHIGDKVLFQDKKLIICEKEAKFEKGELVFYYILAREEYLNVVEYYNQLFTGLTLLGEVIKTSSEKVWLKLDIDGKNGEYDYKWKPTSGSLMYCMPKIGTKASLYFENADERSGIATNSPRTNGGNDEKSDLAFEGFSNVQNRGMVTEHNKRMDMYPSIMRFSGTSNTDIHLEILFDDEKGLKFESNKILNIIALEEIEIKSEKNIILQSFLSNIIVRTSLLFQNFLDEIVSKGTYSMMKSLNEKKDNIQIQIVDNDTMFIMNNRFDIISYENIVYQGRVYMEFPPFDDAPKEGKFDWSGLIAGIAIGAVCTIAVCVLAVGIAAGIGGMIAAVAVAKGIALVGGLCIGIKATSDIMSGNVSPEEYIKVGTKAALDEAIGVGFASLFATLTIIKNGAKCSQLVKNIVNTVGATVAEEVATGAASRSLDIAIDSELTFKDNTLNYLLAPKEIGYDLAIAGVSSMIAAKNIKKISEPVDAITGSFLIEQCDLIINDILEDVAIERNYQSIYNNVSLIGKGWNLSIFSHLELQTNYITLYTLDNGREVFEVKENEIKSVRNCEEVFLLSKIENGYKVYYSLKKHMLIYQENGLLLYVIDANGNRREYIYENDILKMIKFPSGQYFNFEIKENKIRKITDNMNREIKYEYDGDYLISVEIPNKGIERYNYNEQGVIESVTNVEGITFVNNKYDEKNRVIYQTVSTGQEYKFIYDDENRVNTYILPKMNREIKYYYDEKNEPTKIVYQDGTYEEIKYDMWENIIYEKDRLGNETRYVYNNKCLKLEEYLPNGLTTYYEYDEKDNLIKEWDKTDKEYRYIYDEKGNVIKSVGKIDEEKQLIVTYEYDQYGRVTKEIDPEGREKVFEYSFQEGEFNKPTKYITNEENIYKYTYDKGGRCRTVENSYGIRAFEYDPMDIMTKEIDQLGNTTVYEYDQMFNLKKLYYQTT